MPPVNSLGFQLPNHTLRRGLIDGYTKAKKTPGLPPVADLVEAVDGLEALMEKHKTTMPPKLWAILMIFYGSYLKQETKWQ